MSWTLSRARHAARWLKSRLQNRGDSEHEQALIRIGIVAGLTVYALLGPMPEASPIWWVPSPLQLALLVLAASLAHFAWILAQPRVNEPRRALSMLVDHVGVIVGMAIGGAATALLYPILLWVTLGHLFRYGRGYMIGSALISVSLFCLLIVVSPYWRSLGLLNVGLAMGLLMIPAYCLRLSGQLHEARRRAEASSEAKSRFLATMSHELRTPLHAILGMTELLRGTRLAPEQREMTRTIQSAGNGLLSIIEDVLDIARIEAGAEPIQPAPFDVQRVARDVCDLVGHEAKRKHLPLWLRVEPSVPPLLEGPGRAVYQILVNLLANAVKFTEQGHVRLTVGGEDDGAGSFRVRLAVEDTGVGVPVAARERIFESFTQADDGITRRYGGTGLGLAIVKRLAEGAGGRVGYAPRLGGGSRFEVELPVRALPDDDSPTAGEIVVHGTVGPEHRALLAGLGVPWRAGGGSGAVGNAVDLWIVDDRPLPARQCGARDLVVLGDVDVEGALAILPALPTLTALKRAVRAALLVAEPAAHDAQPVRVKTTARSLDVLIADDNRVNQQVVERMLQRAGHRVVVVEDGVAALEVASRSHFDVAVLDLNMPHRGGMDVARELSRRPDRPRLVALSADATPAMRLEAAQAGFDAYLTKPVTGRELLAEMAGDTLAAPSNEASPPAPAEVGLDRRRFEMLRSLDAGDGFLADVVRAFVNDGQDLIDELERAAAIGDLRAFRDAAHALRSSATHLGATAVFERCLEGKRLTDGALAREAPAIAAEVRRVFEATVGALAAEMGAVDLNAAHPVGLGSARAAPSSAGLEDRAPERARSTAR